jgi:DNA-binding transcriptional LysR family regulator
MGAAKFQEKLQSATPEVLSAFTWVMPPSHCPFRELQLKIFKDHFITPSQSIGADSEEVIRPLVVQGKALALVRDDEATSMLDSGRGAVCTSLGRHPVELNFVYRKSQAEDPAIAALITVVRELWSV